MPLLEKGGRVRTDATLNGLIRETLKGFRPASSDCSMNAHLETLSECRIS
jgi:hypothetical protein